MRRFSFCVLSSDAGRSHTLQHTHTHCFMKLRQKRVVLETENEFKNRIECSHWHWRAVEHCHNWQRGCLENAEPRPSHCLWFTVCEWVRPTSQGWSVFGSAYIFSPFCMGFEGGMTVNDIDLKWLNTLWPLAPVILISLRLFSGFILFAFNVFFYQ